MTGTNPPSGALAAFGSDETAHLKQDRAIRTRAVILNAAAEVFAEHGFPNVTVKNIADRAELTKGAVYFHFTNKEALAVAVTEHFYRRLSAVVRTSLEGGDTTSVATVKDVFLGVAKAFRDDPLVQAGARLQIERPYIKADLPTPYTDFTDRITDVLQQCQEAGALPQSTNPAALARVLRSALFGAQHISWVTQGRSDIVERVREITEAVLPAA